jgi:hypothetical protein
MNKNTDRQAGLVPEDEYIAHTQSSVPRHPQEMMVRESYARGMRFSVLCTRYGLRPDVILRVLGIDKQQVDESEWYFSLLNYDKSRDLTRNGLRGERGGEPTDNRRDVCTNPIRGPR